MNIEVLLLFTLFSYFFKLIEEDQYDQHKKYSAFERPQDGSKNKSVSFTIYDFYQFDQGIF